MGPFVHGSCRGMQVHRVGIIDPSVVLPFAILSWAYRFLLDACFVEVVVVGSIRCSQRKSAVGFGIVALAW